MPPPPNTWLIFKGGVPTRTVTDMPHCAVLPHVSVTVNVTGVVPAGEVPEAFAPPPLKLLTTVKLVPHVAVFPLPSVTVIVTGCGPSPTSAPATGDCVMMNVQLSLAMTWDVKSGTAAWHELLAEADWAGAQLVMVGGVVSFTV